MYRKRYENDIIIGMEAYFSGYKERFPHKSVEDAIRTTRNWAEGLIKAFRGAFIDHATLEKIKRRLNELRIKDNKCS